MKTKATLKPTHAKTPEHYFEQDLQNEITYTTEDLMDRYNLQQIQINLKSKNTKNGIRATQLQLSYEKTPKETTLYKTIKQLNQKYDNVDTPLIQKHALNKGITEQELPKLLTILKRNADIYSPKKDIYIAAEVSP